MNDLHLDPNYWQERHARELARIEAEEAAGADDDARYQPVAPWSAEDRADAEAALDARQAELDAEAKRVRAIVEQMREDAARTWGRR